MIGSHPQSTSESRASLQYDVPKRLFIAVDYPGYVVNKEKAIASLGGLTYLAECYQAIVLPDSNALKPVELWFRPEDPFSHPILGNFVSTCNLLVRIVRRRKKGSSQPWRYFIEIQGALLHTCRFRGLADFQWIPHPNDPITQLRSAMADLDLFRILSFEMSSDDTNLNPIRSFPPPTFSKIDLPKNYDFKQCHMLSKVEIQNPDGTTSFRLHNPFRLSAKTPISSVSFQDPIPTAPPDWKPRHLPTGWKEILLRKFEERPVWTKFALFNTLTQHPKVKRKLRQILPLVAYFVTSGPWKFTWIKLGLDPKLHSKYRFFQTLDTRNYYRQYRVSEERGVKLLSNRHLFNGLQRNEATSIFQFCDLVDPILSELVHNQEYLRDVVHPLDGWYQRGLIIKLRARFRSRRKSLIHGIPYVPPPQDSLDISKMLEDEGDLGEDGDDADRSLLHPKESFPASSQIGVQAQVNEIMLQLSHLDPIWQTDSVNQGDDFDIFDEDEFSGEEGDEDDDEDNNDDDIDNDEEEDDNDG